MPVKFYTDEHVAQAVVSGLRRRGIDVLSVPEAAMMGARDEEHLDFADLRNRVVFTQDEDFLVLHASGISHAGIAYAPQGTAVGPIIRGLVLIHQILTPEEMRNHLEFI